MSSGLALSIEGVWKQFARRGIRSMTLKNVLLHQLAPFRRDYFWALKDVNAKIGLGETFGVIGENGSGKSTLLRLVAGLGRPSRGTITRGREIQALLSLGDSFDPLLTGRENALTAGILAGLRRRQIGAKLDEIAEFAELEEFIDDPLRTYSDGMRLRLAFAVATSTQPEIMLIDEVLSVGDLRFQQKCLSRLRELQAGGTTILLASHDESQVRDLCERALWLARGRVGAIGDPTEVYDAYHQSLRIETERRAAELNGRGAPARSASVDGENRLGTAEVEIVAVRVDPSTLQVSSEGAPIRLEIDLVPNVPVSDAIVGVSLHRVGDLSKALDVSTDTDGVRLGRLDGPRTVSIDFDRLDVEPGSYRFDVGVYEKGWSYVYDYHWHAYPLEVVSSARGASDSPHRWLLM
jgi:lipopolysaccharide transport system ATP-binding protein